MPVEYRRDAFHAISDPDRRRIIELIGKRPMTVSEITAEFSISRPAISQQLKVLEECGVIEIDKVGRERFCKMRPQNLLPAFLWLEQYNQEWRQRIEYFEKYLTIMDNANKTLTIEKVFDAPVQLVWEAWTAPGHITAWWAPPGMPVTIVQHDFTVGGKWKYVMPMGNGMDFVSEGEYKEIVPFKKLVTTANFRPMTENVELHILFDGDEKQTKFTFSVVHASEEEKMQQEKMGFYNGWGSAFNRLGEYLKKGDL